MAAGPAAAPTSRPRPRPGRLRAWTARRAPAGRPPVPSATRSCGSSTPTGAPRTTSPSGRSICSTTRFSASGLAAGARQAATARPFRHGAGPQSRLRASEPGYPGTRPRRNLRHGARARRACERRERLPRGDVRGAVSGHLRGRGRGYASCSDSSRSPAASRAMRRRRRPARSTRAASSATPSPRVRRGLRQSRPPRRLRRRRRGGRDRPARGELALEQVPQPAPRRRRAPGPPPERLQDREPDGPRPDPRGASSWRSSRATAGSRCSSPVASTARIRAYVHQRFAGDARRGARPDRRDPAREPGRGAASSVRAGRCSSCGRRRAGPGRGRSTASRWRAPGVRTRCRSRRCATNPEHLRQLEAVAAELPARGALRRERPPRGRAAGARARRPAADERQPARQRRRAAPRPRAPRLPRVRGRGPAAGQEHGRGDARPRRLPPRRHRPEPRDVPSLRPRRDGLEPARRRLLASRAEPGSRATELDRRGALARTGA